ncbi:hypothetical protein, partial [Plasmodium yoelii yoelii]
MIQNIPSVGNEKMNSKCRKEIK